MVLNSAFLLVVRSLSAALFLMVSVKMFVLVSLCDLGAYLIQKGLRGDLRYWIPLYGVSGVLCSFLFRMGIKWITDFTGVIQFRHPGELGGIYWSVNMFVAVAVSWGAAAGYFREERENEEVNKRGLGLILAGLSVGWLLAFGVFLKIMKKEYRSSFWSFKTGRNHTRDYFLEGRTDGEKLSILGDHAAIWEDIRGDVVIWIKHNWWRWQEDRPAFFTDDIEHTILENFVSAEELRVVLDGRQGRRGSFVTKGPLGFGAGTHVVDHKMTAEGGGGGGEFEFKISTSGFSGLSNSMSNISRGESRGMLEA